MLVQLKTHDEQLHKVITSVDLKKWCPAFVPPHVHSHGNWTSNMVECLGRMLLKARRQSTFAGSLLRTLQLIKRRHDSVRKYCWDEVCSKKNDEIAEP